MSDEPPPGLPVPPTTILPSGWISIVTASELVRTPALRPFAAASGGSAGKVGKLAWLMSWPTRPGAPPKMLYQSGRALFGEPDESFIAAIMLYVLPPALYACP